MHLSRAEWRKASKSSSNGGACVEAASLPNIVAVRDSKDPGGPKLAFAPETWRAFTSHVKTGGANLA
jgi:hypothetical protein